MMHVTPQTAAALLTFAVVTMAALWPGSGEDSANDAFEGTFRLLLAFMFSTGVWIATAILK